VRRRDFGSKRLDQKLSEALRPRYQEEEIERFVVAAILAATTTERWSARDTRVLTRYFAKYGIGLNDAQAIGKHFEEHPLNPALAREALDIIVRERGAPRSSDVDGARALVGAEEPAFRPVDPKAPRTAAHQLRALLVANND
jgi:hypothetical protein